MESNINIRPKTPDTEYVKTKTTYLGSESDQIKWLIQNTFFSSLKDNN